MVIVVKEFREKVGSYTFHGYEVGDSGLPTLVCLHGMTGDSKSFLDLAEQLMDDFHLILLDGPGHGETDPLQTEDDYIFSSVVKRMDKVIQKKVVNNFFISWVIHGELISLCTSQRRFLIRFWVSFY